jgi:hypothetical protein
MVVASAPAWLYFFGRRSASEKLNLTKKYQKPKTLRKFSIDSISIDSKTVYLTLLSLPCCVAPFFPPAARNPSPISSISLCNTLEATFLAVPLPLLLTYFDGK